MTAAVQPDAWVPQRWSHADVLDMQSRLDPARMVRYADEWIGVIRDACAILDRLDRAIAERLDGSWTGTAARQASEALRHFISDAIHSLNGHQALADGLMRLSDAASEVRAAVGGADHLEDLAAVRTHYSEPAIAAGGAAPASDPLPVFPLASASPLPATLPPVSTVPAGFGGGHPWGDSSARVDAADADDVFGPPSRVAGPPAAPTDRAEATFVPATPVPTSAPVTPAGASAPGPGGAPLRGGAGYLPLMGALHPGAIGRADPADRPTPGYLVTIDNGDALIGPLPKVAPPVIGGDRDLWGNRGDRPLV